MPNVCCYLPLPLRVVLPAPRYTWDSLGGAAPTMTRAVLCSSMPCDPPPGRAATGMCCQGAWMRARQGSNEGWGKRGLSSRLRHFRMRLCASADVLCQRVCHSCLECALKVLSGISV